MISQDYVQAIQRVFTQSYITSMVNRLQDSGYSDQNPFHKMVQVGLIIADYTLRDVFVSVQTKRPDFVRSEYHIWIMPLSKNVFLGIPSTNEFKHIDEIYAIVNGSDYIIPSSYIDDTASW